MHLINKNVSGLKMTIYKSYRIIILLILALHFSPSYAEYLEETADPSLPTYTLPALTVRGQKIANLRPASTYQSLVSNLDFDPRMDFQSRNMAEAQGDINIRGGIFEATGIQVGSLTLIDPQTGHYSTEIPIAPVMLSAPQVKTGTNYALWGFNSSAGTISYKWTPMISAGSSTLGAGNNGMNYQRIHNVNTNTLGYVTDWVWGTEFEYSRSESDGTIQNGDHDFSRINGRFQLIGPNSQTDFFAGSQTKFFGWPGMYTARKYGNPIEYEDVKTELFIINHRENFVNESFLELSYAFRKVSDTYTLEGIVIDGNYIGNNLSYLAKHKTEASTLSFSGFCKLNEYLGINYSGQMTLDSMNSSNDHYTEFDPTTGEIAIHTSKNDPSITFPADYRTNGFTRGRFNTRSYEKLSILPEYKYKLNQNESITIRAGGTFDYSNRDSSKVSPIADITWKHHKGENLSDKAYLSFAQTTQILGYSAIGGSETSGIFKSKHDLKRGVSKNLEFGFALERPSLLIEGAIFYVWDKNLADWTFSREDEYARYANNLDMETFGVELVSKYNFGKIRSIASYTYLDKDANYDDTNFDASFYALNYANHRITLGAIWKPNNLLQVSIDNEWRSQEENTQRNGDNEAVFTHLSLSIFPPKYPGLEVFAAVDNIWDDNFEDMPGTPGKGKQGSCGATFKW